LTIEHGSLHIQNAIVIVGKRHQAAVRARLFRLVKDRNEHGVPHSTAP